MPSDIFISIEGIEGESTDAEFAGQIEVLGYNETVTMPTTGASSGGADTSGRAEIMPLQIIKEMDASSPLLRQALCNAQVIPEVTLTLRRMVQNVGEPYMVYKLVKAKIVDVALNGDGASGSIPTESVSFRFEEMHYTYKNTGSDASGNVEFKWSMKQNIQV